jgi:hypothetical protein
MIARDFGSVEKMIEKFNDSTTAVQGSGWGWLVYSPVLDRLAITSTPNQDRPEDHAPVRAILGVCPSPPSPPPQLARTFVLTDRPTLSWCRLMYGNMRTTWTTRIAEPSI